MKNFDDYQVKSEFSLGTIEVNKIPRKELVPDIEEKINEETLQKQITGEIESIQEDVADIVELKHSLPSFNKYPIFN